MKWMALFFTAVLLTATLSPAQVTVTKSGSPKSALDLSAFTSDQSPAAEAFRQTLEADLLRSGWFGKSTRGAGEYTLVGSCEGGAGIQAKCSVYGVASRRHVLSESYRDAAAAARRLAHQAADDIVEAVTGRRGIASSRIALVGNRTRSKELYVVDADGQNLIQLTQDKSLSVAPKWSKDGKELIYTAYLKGFPDVYRVALAGGQRSRVASFSGLNTGAAFSPNGNDVALILSKDGNPELYVMNLRGGALTRLTATRNAAEASPAWSPDGKRIVYVSDQSGHPQLYVLSRGGGAPTRLTTRGSENVSPDWGPDYGSGGLIAFSSRLGGQYQIGIISPDSGEMKYLVLDGADWEDPSWAPDGRHLVCTRSESYRAKAYLLDTMGDPPLPLTRHDGDWYSPDWSR